MLSLDLGVSGMASSFASPSLKAVTHPRAAIALAPGGVDSSPMRARTERVFASSCRSNTTTHDPTGKSAIFSLPMSAVLRTTSFPMAMARGAEGCGRLGGAVLLAVGAAEAGFDSTILRACAECVDGLPRLVILRRLNLVVSQIFVFDLYRTTKHGY
jgi:hypothetical protein